MKKIKKTKMLSSHAILFSIIVVVAILTWIVPAGKYSNQCTTSTFSQKELAGQSFCVDEELFNQLKVADTNELSEVLTNNALESRGKWSIVRAKGEVKEISYDGQVIADNKTEKTYTKTKNNGQGVWQVVNAPILGFYDAVDIALFVIIIGGFIGLVLESGALDAGIASLITKFRGREQLLIPILMVIFGLGGTTFGMAEETIAFYPLLIPIILAAGYDVATAVMIILFGAGSGVLGSTINPFAIGAATSAAGVSLGDGILLRVILFVVVEAFVIFYTMRYASSVKKGIQNSKVIDLHQGHLEHFLHGKETENPEFKKGHGIILTLFSLTFVVMILGVIPWTDFGINTFKNLNDGIMNLPIIGKVLTGNDGSTKLGSWWFGEMTMLFLVASVILGAYTKKRGLLNDKNPIAVFVNGSKDLLGVAIIIGLSRGIKIVMDAGSMSDTLLYYGSGSLRELGNTAFILLNYIFYIPMSFLIPSTSGLAGATMSILGPMGELVTGSSAGTNLVITGYSAASGIVNYITPTSGVVMGALILAKIPYERWLKIALPVIAYIFVITLVVLGTASVVTL